MPRKQCFDILSKYEYFQPLFVIQSIGVMFLYTYLMLEFGNACELILFGGAGHGFFNFGRAEGKYYRRTVALMDIFLQEYDFIR